MKNNYNFSQVAEVYCKEVEVEIPEILLYLQAVFSGQDYSRYEKIIISAIRKSYNEKTIMKSEYFSDWA